MSIAVTLNKVNILFYCVCQVRMIVQNNTEQNFHVAYSCYSLPEFTGLKLILDR
jgi:hypothetical protein